MFTENRIIEYIDEHRNLGSGYVISGHCGVVAYMLLAAVYILNKKKYAVSQFLVG